MTPARPARATPLQVDPSRIEAVPHEELLWLFVMLTILLLAARVLGVIARRFGLPTVVGELTAGVVVGPSLLGAFGLAERFVAATTGHAVESELLFPLIEVVSWIGLLMLIVLTGLETDLDLIVSKATEATTIALSSIVVPFALGFGFAWYLPERFVHSQGDRLTFALFVAVAMSISAIPVIAKILMDMDQIRREFGQVTLASGMINDTVGWIMLALVAGLAEAGEVEVSQTLVTILALVAFLGLGFTVGQRVVRWLIVWVDNEVGGEVAKISTLMILALGVGSVTHAMHLEAVLGAFVVGILAGQVNRFDYQTEHTFEVLTVGVFAPIFFAAAGLRVDLLSMADPVVFAAGAGALAIAIVGKFVGTYVGAVAVGMDRWEGVTMGAGLNARGAMEIIVATVGLSANVLTTEVYSIIVMIAILTSVMAPPMLRATIPKLPMSEAERERLEAEERERHSFLGGVTRVLLPSRGGADTQFAAQLLGYVQRGREIDVTPYYVKRREGGRSWRRRVARFVRTLRGTQRRHPTEHDADPADPESVVDLITAQLQLTAEAATSSQPVVETTSGSVSDAIVEEAGAYDLLVLGETGRGRRQDESLFSPTVDTVLQHTPIPTMVVSSKFDTLETLDLVPTDRILLPTVGTEYSRHAAEVAFAIAAERNAIVEVVHVVSEPEVPDRFVEQPDLSNAVEIGQEIVDREAQLGRGMGAEVITDVRVGEDPEREIVDMAAEDDVDLVVMGSDIRPVTQRAFFGHRVEYVVGNAPCPVAVLTSP